MLLVPEEVSVLVELMSAYICLEQNVEAILSNLVLQVFVAYTVSLKLIIFSCIKNF